jgi:hypothetical protein
MSDDSSSVIPQGALVALNDLDAFAHISGEWEALRERASYAAALSSFEAIRSWWTVFGPELNRQFGRVSLHILTFRSSCGDLIGAITTYKIARSIQRMVPAQLVSIGRWPNASVETLCEESTNLICGETASLVFEQLGDYLASEFASGQIDYINILWAGQQFPEEIFKNVVGTRLGRSSILTLRPGIPCTYVTLAETWAEHRKIMSKSMRDNLAYYPKLLARNELEWQVRRTSVAQDVESAVKTLAGMHRARSIHQSTKMHTIHITGTLQEQFLAQLVMASLHRHEGFIAELSINHKVVASQAFLVKGETLTLLYSGFDPEWRKFSPIFVLDAQIIQELHENGVRLLNFLTGTKKWQLRWGRGSSNRRAKLEESGHRRSRTRFRGPLFPGDLSRSTSASRSRDP